AFSFEQNINPARLCRLPLCRLLLGSRGAGESTTPNATESFLHEFEDEQDNKGSAQNEHPIGNLRASYGCCLAKPVHDFPPRLAQSAASVPSLYRLVHGT